MALHLIPSEILRNECRRRIESFELWLRRLVHDTFREEFDELYVESAMCSGNAIFTKNVQEHVKGRCEKDPHDFKRPVDALMLNQLSDVICKPDVFAKYFRQPFYRGFPLGNEHLRFYLDRILPLRNALSHANHISTADAERSLCYCSDIIDSLKEFYAEKGMEQEFNAPSFTRFSDSLGNVIHISNSEGNFVFDKIKMRVGDALRLEIEVDSSFSLDEYTVQWYCYTNPPETQDGTSFFTTLELRHVGIAVPFQCVVKSSKTWHRHSDYDARFSVYYTVLPQL